MKPWTLFTTAVAAAAACALALSAQAAQSIVGSPHDLNQVLTSYTAANDGEVCKPCHTPHNMPDKNVGKLWNHAMPTTAYKLYGTTDYLSGGSESTNLDETSRKCLGCHDGTTAIDSFGGITGTHTIAQVDNVAGTILQGTANVASGYVIGNGDLTHDHPIDVAYNKGSRLTTSDATHATWNSTSFNDPGTGSFDANNYKSLDSTGTLVSKPYAGGLGGLGGRGVSLSKVTNTGATSANQVTVTVTGTGGYTYSTNALYITCGSCHTPHDHTYKFLKVPNTNSQLCLTCHIK